jgi:hypothetical protein
MADTEVRTDPKEAYFRLGMGMPSHRCGDCIAYQNGKCVTVAVEPSADDICRLFRPHPANGSMSAMQAGALSMIGRSTGELSLFINRVSRDPQTGIRRWYSTASGTKRDLYNEKMSVPLFKDFIRRIEAGEKAPEPFASRAWQGGLPYLGVAHYLDMEGEAIVGTTDRVWVDADIFKARGTFGQGPLADAAFKAIQEDIRLNRRTPLDEQVGRRRQHFANATRNSDVTEKSKQVNHRTLVRTPRGRAHEQFPVDHLISARRVLLLKRVRFLDRP